MAVMYDFHIRPLEDSDFDNVLAFTDENIGAGYFSAQKLRHIFQKSKWQERSMSFVLVDEENKIHGVRLSYPPQQWPGRPASQPVHPSLWQVSIEKVAYFQSLFLGE